MINAGSETFIEWAQLTHYYAHRCDGLLKFVWPDCPGGGKPEGWEGRRTRTVNTAAFPPEHGSSATGLGAPWKQIAPFQKPTSHLINLTVTHTWNVLMVGFEMASVLLNLWDQSSFEVGAFKNRHSPRGQMVQATATFGHGSLSNSSSVETMTNPRR